MSTKQEDQLLVFGVTSLVFNVAARFKKSPPWVRKFSDRVALQLASVVVSQGIVKILEAREGNKLGTSKIQTDLKKYLDGISGKNKS